MSWTLDQSKPKARKNHECLWCGQPIPKGEIYSRWVGIFEGDFNCNKMHLECSKAFSEEENEGFILPGENERPPRNPGDDQ